MSIFALLLTKKHGTMGWHHFCRSICIQLSQWFYCEGWKTIVLIYHKIKPLQKRLFNPLCILAKRICTAKEATYCFFKAIPFWKVRNKYLLPTFYFYLLKKMIQRRFFLLYSCSKPPILFLYWSFFNRVCTL